MLSIPHPPRAFFDPGSLLSYAGSPFLPNSKVCYAMRVSASSVPMCLTLKIEQKERHFLFRKVLVVIEDIEQHIVVQRRLLAQIKQGFPRHNLWFQASLRCLRRPHRRNCSPCLARGRWRPGRGPRRRGASCRGASRIDSGRSRSGIGGLRRTRALIWDTFRSSEASGGGGLRILAGFQVNRCCGSFRAFTSNFQDPRYGSFRWRTRSDSRKSRFTL